MMANYVSQMEIAPGLHRIGDDVIAAHLIVTPDGVTLIDAGLPGLRRALRRELSSLSLNEADIRGIILTHADSDHLGFAEALRAEHGIPVYVGEGEEGYALRRRPAEPNEKSAWRLGSVLRFLWAGIRIGGRTRALSDVHTAVDGDVLDLPGAPRIIATPGHTRGHIAVWSGVVDAVFVGDAVTTRHVLTGAEGPADAPFSEDPARARDSVERLKDLGARYVLPGHGPVWSGGTAAFVERVQASRVTLS